MTWKALGTLLPGELSDARLRLHWAAQLLSAPGASLLPAEDDYSHTNLGWDTGLGLLTGRKVGSVPLRSALVFEGLELVVLDAARERSSMRLAGHTLEEALTWLSEELTGQADSLSFPTHEMPSHGLREGGVFSDADSASRIELASWFSDAFSLIAETVADEPNAAPVRCWPHHFDVASLIPLDVGVGDEEARSIGVGFSPGDGSYAQPYFYVTPWPYPEIGQLPALAAGAHWHTEHWTGAVLLGERLISVPSDEQRLTARKALDRAVAACRELLAA
jgi:hypothetical protein